LKKIKLKLEEGKTVELFGFSLIETGDIVAFVNFVELGIQRKEILDIIAIKQWLKNNPEKKLTDYLTERLLPLYNRLAYGKELKEMLEAVAT